MRRRRIVKTFRVTASASKKFSWLPDVPDYRYGPAYTGIVFDTPAKFRWRIKMKSYLNGLRAGAAGLFMFGAAGAHAASLTYSDFTDADTYPGSGYCINGPDASACGAPTPYWPAQPFVSKLTGFLDHLDIPMSYQSGTQGVMVTLVNDNGGSPAVPTKVLESFLVTTLPTTSSSTDKVRLTSKLHPQLVSGTTYWVIVSPLGYDTVATWNEANRKNGSAGSLTENGGASWGFNIPSLAVDAWVD
jgi:hypothetical protein